MRPVHTEVAGPYCTCPQTPLHVLAFSQCDGNAYEHAAVANNTKQCNGPRSQRSQRAPCQVRCGFLLKSFEGSGKIDVATADDDANTFTLELFSKLESCIASGSSSVVRTFIPAASGTAPDGSTTSFIRSHKSCMRIHRKLRQQIPSLPSSLQ